MVIIAAMFLWWSMHVDVKFHSHSEWNFFQQVTGEAYRHLSEASCYLNMIGLALIYALLVTCINRFWVGTALFGTLVMVFSVATRIKVTMRNEPVIPSDLGILTGNGGGGAGEVASFITEESQPLVNAAVTLLIWFAAICIMLQLWIDGVNSSIALGVIPLPA